MVHTKNVNPPIGHIVILSSTRLLNVENITLKSIITVVIYSIAHVLYSMCVVK